ncbi:hypothetical protein HpNP55_05660 [Helicobacter pylori]
MKKSFKKLGFVSLVASSVLLGSMNATDLETYAALQKPSHVFGNYAETKKDSKEDNKTPTPKQQAQTTASSDSTQASTAEKTATTDNTTAATDETYTKSADKAVSGAAQKVEADNTTVQQDEKALKSAVEKVQADASATDFDETTFTQDQAAEQTAEANLKTAKGQLTQDQDALDTALQDQKKTPTPSTPPPKEEPKHTASSGTPSSSGSGVASQLVKDTTTVNNLKSVSVSGMNTTLSGVETMSQQSATIGNLLNSSTDLSSVIPNAQGLSSVFSALESAQNTLKGYFRFF